VNKTARKPLNLKAVAKILGVSTATVSNAFNRPNQLSASLREKILKECDELGYHGPNLAARSLRKGQSDVIAVVLADSLGYSFSDPVASQFLQGVSEVLAEHNKQLLLLSSKFTGKEQSSAESLPDGFIFYGTPSGDCFERIYKFGKKVVAVDFESHADVFTIQVDNKAAAYKSAQHALQRHNGSLAISGLRLLDTDRVCRLTEQDMANLPDHVSHERLRGYLAAANESNNALPAHMVWNTPVNVPEYAEIAAREILTSQPTPSTVLCMSDVLALAVIRQANAMQIAVPEQVQVVGFDDIPEASRVEPPLTTVCQQNIEKGRVAARCLLNPNSINTISQENNDTSDNKPSDDTATSLAQIIPTKLVARASTRK